MPRQNAIRSRIGDQASDHGRIPAGREVLARLSAETPQQLRVDSTACQKFWRSGAKLRAELPARSACSEDQARAVQVIHTRERDLRDQFLATHAEALYGKLTNNRKNFVRVEQLVRDGAKLVPGLLPSEKELAAEAPLALKDKERIESIRASSFRIFWPTQAPAGISVMPCCCRARKPRSISRGF
jgi:hypothetical protein